MEKLSVNNVAAIILICFRLGQALSLSSFNSYSRLNPSYHSGAPNDGFLPNALKTCFRLSGVLFKLCISYKTYICSVILGQL